jgi:hypothetical protein
LADKEVQIDRHIWRVEEAVGRVAVVRLDGVEWFEWISANNLEFSIAEVDFCDINTGISGR